VHQPQPLYTDSSYPIQNDSTTNCYIHKLEGIPPIIYSYQHRYKKPSDFAVAKEKGQEVDDRTPAEKKKNHT
jgi:hypothetical protein